MPQNAPRSGDPIPATLDKPIPESLLPIMRQARRDGFLTYTKRQSDAVLVWFDLCDQLNQAFVSVRTGTKYGTIVASLQIPDKHFSLIGLKILRSLLAEVSTKPKSVQSSDMFVAAGGIPLECTHHVASRLVQLVRRSEVAR